MKKSEYKIVRSQLDFKFQPKYFFFQISLDIMLLICMSYLFSTSWAVLNIFIVPLFMFRQFAILHEAVHGLTHSQDRINLFLGIVSGTFCLTPFVVWKTAHLKHHYWTGNLEKDPTFTILKNFHQSSLVKKNFLQKAWKIGFPLLGILQHVGFSLHFIQNFWSNKKNGEYWLNLISPLVICAFIFKNLSFTDLAILCFGIMLYFRLFEDMLIPQHVGLCSDDHAEMHLHAWEQTEVTRSWKLNPIMEKLFALNMNYHTEHHLLPDLPWHELKKAHSIIQNASEKNSLNLITLEWMSSQRKREFAHVIQPIPAIKKSAA